MQRGLQFQELKSFIGFWSWKLNASSSATSLNTMFHKTDKYNNFHKTISFRNTIGYFLDFFFCYKGWSWGLITRGELPLQNEKWDENSFKNIILYIVKWLARIQKGQAQIELVRNCMPTVPNLSLENSDFQKFIETAKFHFFFSTKKIIFRVDL